MSLGFGGTLMIPILQKTRFLSPASPFLIPPIVDNLRTILHLLVLFLLILSMGRSVFVAMTQYEQYSIWNLTLQTSYILECFSSVFYAVHIVMPDGSNPLPPCLYRTVP